MVIPCIYSTPTCKLLINWEYPSGWIVEQKPSSLVPSYNPPVAVARCQKSILFWHVKKISRSSSRLLWQLSMVTQRQGRNTTSISFLELVSISKGNWTGHETSEVWQGKEIRPALLPLRIHLDNSKVALQESGTMWMEVLTWAKLTNKKRCKVDCLSLCKQMLF